MSLIGVSMLEMRQIIEQACLPDRCEISCPDGTTLTIRLGQGQSLEQAVTLSGISLQSLNNCRDLVNLVGQLHTLRGKQPKMIKAIA
ncbi:DUF1652 domain-containing protein [Pseudomonas promysalinigenes]|jgi:hypothetical protein|uniref:DUF1652 domain-containing protein n=1 Tax=Pseudomonas promysalinigenes TaxID=485898 RepID=A0ABY6ASD0_9PSED|nr:DUF1652 domain-containing protein [Pseudomonas promysalinigenes]UXH42075.1 DUF1652 domain-containing protein [Pseudomonas promysalinigenes]